MDRTSRSPPQNSSERASSSRTSRTPASPSPIPLSASSSPAVTTGSTSSYRPSTSSCLRSPNAATSWRRPQPRAPERPESSASPTSSCATATPASPPCSRSTPGGTVTIAVTVAGDDVVVSFADTGMGIPADEIDRLFTRFFRSSTAMRQAVQGVGLGLSITKAIVTAHGGSLGVESEQGVGTTFTMSLPIARVD
ncbi:hypothetical protein E6C70_01845 [Glaciibacter flavus]|uniref:histidine kinase n=1 Tax=Orlajensenia flava TaxID=2565934 RepID=A0A4S4G023_9MICO|nr:hypothetical protein E6C70_01845 [Glaciibacter flavus]